MNTIKKLLALVVASVMLVGVVPMGVLANPNQLAADQAAQDAQAAQLQAQQEAQAQAEAEAAARQAAYEEAAKQAAENAAKQAQEQQAQINQQQAQQSQSWKQVDQASAPEAQKKEQADSKEKSQEKESEDKTEEKYPERTLADVSLGNGAVLSVFAPEGALKENAQVKVTAPSADAQNAAKALLESAVDGELTETKQYQISFVEDGKEVSPKKDVKLTFKGVTMFGEKVALFRIDGSASKQDASASSTNVTLTANSAKPGTYAIAASRAPQQEETDNNKEEAASDDDADADAEAKAEAQAEPTETPAATDGLSDDDKAAVIDALRSFLSLTAVPVSEEAAAAAAAEATKEDAAEEAKVNYPAFETSQAVAGTSMTVNVSAPEGAFPEGIQLSATAVSTPADVLAAIKADNGEVANDDIVSVDVHFYLPDNSGAEIEPKVPINVTFSNINLDAETVDVYHEAEKIAETSGEGGTLALDQFSTYTFVKSSQGDPVVEQTRDEATQLTVHNLKLALKNGETESIDLKTDRSVAEYKNTNPDDTENYGKVYDITPASWDVNVDGTSVEVDSNFVLTAKELGSSTVTLTHKPLEDGYWDKPDIKLTATFTVNVVTEVTYDGNGGTTAAGNSSYTSTYSDDASAVVDGNNFTKFGHTFKGWAKRPVAYSEGSTYLQPGDGVMSNSLYSGGVYGETLYAVWEEEEPITISINKVWDDASNRDGKRPNSVTFNIEGTLEGETEPLYTRTYEIATAHTITEPIKVSKDGEGKQFYKEIGDKKVNYTVTENEIADYTAEISEVAADGTVTIKNTHKPEIYESIPVSKVWDDSDNQDGSRPTSGTVYLRLYKADGTYANKQKAVSATEDSSTAFESKASNPIYKYENGEEIEYTVREFYGSSSSTAAENAIQGYEMSVSGSAADGFTVTNSHMPEKIKITATKVWEDNNNQDGKRTDVTLTLEGRLASGRLVSTASQTHNTEVAGMEKFDFGLKPKHFEGEEIIWTPIETPIDGYDVDVTSETDKYGNISYTVTNKHEPEKRTLKVTKSWENENGETSHRADVKVNVFADGTPLNEQLVITGDASETTWTNTLEVDKYTFDPETGKGGHEITYTVEEAEDVPFYRNDGATGDMVAGFTLTNTYIPNTTTVTINKVWKDAKNKDGLRPDVAHVLLMNNGVMVRESNLRAQDDWTVTFTDVPVYSDPSDSTSVINYKVEEENNYGYIVTVAKEGDAVDGYTYTVTNTMEDAGKIDIPVKKVWNDGDNRDGLRPESVDVTLQAGGEDVDTLTLTEADGWEGTFTVPSMDIETEETIEYSLVEDTVIDGYTAEISGDAATGFTVTNTHKPEEIPEIKATKVWDDADNQDGIRPQNIYLRLYKADGTYAGKQKALNGDQTEVTFTTSQKTPIYKYENGKEIEYTIVESANRSGDPVPVDGYEMTSVTGSAAEGFVVTNTHKPEIREITVTKEWDDNDNQDGIRPSEIYVALYDGDNRLRQRALSEANGWTTTITAENQYKYRPGEQGTLIDYTVEESWVQGTHKPQDPSGKYTYVSTEGDMDAGFTITNKHEPELVDINVTKEWDDDNDRDSKQPEEITIILRADGEEVARGTATAAGTDPWTYSFTNMPVYKNGETIAYTVSEDYDEDYASYYYMSVSDPDYQVVADGNDQLNYTITNKYGPEETTVPVVKRWDDNNDQDGLRPESVTVTLKADGEPAKDAAGNVITATLSEANSWAHYFEGVPKNVKESTGSRAIKYTVEETGYKMAGAEEVEGTPEGYKVTYSDYADNADFTITNTHKPEEVRYHIVKKWEDDNDRDGIRPETVSFTLESYTGEWNEAEGKPGDDFDLISSEEIMLSARSDSHDKNTWDRYIEVPKYANGAEIKYYLAETVPQGYTADQEAIVLAADADNIITNTYTPELVEITVTKVWNDSDNQDGLRPTSVRAFVYANGEYAKRQTELSESNSWTATIKSTNATKLYKYDENGKEIKYTVKESSSGKSVQPIKNYTSKVTGSVEDGFTITNTHEAETIDVTVRKDWDDADDQDGKRPESLEIQLLADGEKVGEAVRIGLADNWEKVYEDLPAYKNGTAIKYTATETVPTGYTQETSTNAEVTVDSESKVIDLKNKYAPEKVDINVTKIWDDDNNHDKKRPDSVTYTLFADTVPVKTVELTTTDATANDANKWEKTIAGQPKYSNGKEIAYTIGEKPVTDYTTTYETSMTEATTDSNKAFNFTVTNKYEPGKTTITVQKVWDDADNQDGKRPESVTAKLQFKCPADNMNDWIDHPEQPALKLNEAGDWKGTWDVYTQRVETGSDLEFNVVETGVPAEYSSSVKSDGDLFTITNKHVPEKGLIAIEKTWTDDSDRDGKRPNSVTIDILGAYLGKDGNAHVAERFDFTINKSTANDGDVWFDVVEVPKYCDGSEILWTAIEKAIDGYEPQGAIGTVGGLLLEYYKPDTDEGINKVENKHEPELVKIPVTKVWDDNDDQDGKRPDEINLHVVGYAGKKEVIRRDVTWPKSKTSSTITKDNSLDAPLYKYYEGQEIRYEVTEDAVEDYTTAVTGNVEDGFTITNTHEPATANLTVNKKWDDKDNQDGKRPEYLEITLTNNVDNTEKTVRMGLADNWSYTFENLPVYKGGNAIKYSVSEVVPAGYMPVGEVGSTEATLENGDATITITNQYTPETLTIEVDKTWDDESNQDGKRPEDGATITLLADNVSVDQGVFEGAKDEETVTFTELPVYANGKKIAYSVVEQKIDGYTTDIEARPMYVDAGEDGEEGTDDDFNKQVFAVTNTDEPEMTTITVVKAWDDENDQDGLRPEAIQFTLKGSTESKPDVVNATDYLNEKNDWTYTEDMPVMHEGEVITYTVEETGYKEETTDEDVMDGVPEGYTAEVSNLADDGYFTITNTHKPEKGLIPIEKTWDDDDDRDGKRPNSVTFDILGVYVDSEGAHVADRRDFTIRKSTANSENVWFDVLEVPKYCDGSEIYWSAIEDEIEGYEPQGAIAEDGGIDLEYYDPIEETGINSVTNKHTPELVEIPVTKVWDDNDDQDGKRPDEIKLHVVGYVGKKEVIRRDVTWPKSKTSSTITKDNSLKAPLYKYYEGQEIRYEVTEDAVEDYTTAVTGNVEDGFTITNTHVPEKIQITVYKDWNDTDNQDGLRPEYVDMQLMGNGAAVGDSVRVSGPAWVHTFTDLPKYEGGKPVEYYVTETAVDGYTTTYNNGSVTESDATKASVNGMAEGATDYADKDTDRYTIRVSNSHTPATCSFIIRKEWEDDSDHDKLRPEELRVFVLEDNRQVEAAVMTAANADPADSNVWWIAFKDLPKYEDGAEIPYTIAEESIDDYTLHGNIEYFKYNEYTGAVPDSIAPTADADKAKTSIVTMSNKHDKNITSLMVTKVWEDENDADGIRPDSVTMNLFATYEDPDTGETVTVDSETLKADEGIETKATLDKSTTWAWAYKDLPLLYKGNRLSYDVTEDPVEGYEAEESRGLEDGYVTITNVHKVDRVDHTVTIKWDDNNNQDGNRPDYVNVYLTKNGERTGDPVTLTAANGWTYTWKDLPAKEYVDGVETAVKYGAVQVTPLDSKDSGVSTMSVETQETDPYSGTYTEESSTTEDGTTTIVNKYTPKTIDIAGKKIWEDNSNQDGVRPESIKINLYADGALIDTKEVTAEAADPENGDIWNYEFKGLPRYIDGRLVHYQVMEEAIANYTPRVVGYDIYNTYTPGKTFTTVIKLWDDDMDRDGIRPDNVIVRLLANGEEVNRASISLASGWFTIWTGLDVNNAGTPIEYSVTEDAVEGYTSEVTGDVKTGFTVKNTHTSERVDVTVKKVWEDDNNKKKLRPQSITVNLLVNGMKVDSHTLTKADGWKTTFKDMPKYANGLPINYVIAEDEVPGYYATVSGDTITNTLRELCPNYCKPNSGLSATGVSSGITSVKTGDASNIAILILLLLVGTLAITQAVVSRKRTGR